MSEFDEQLGLGFPAVTGELPKLAAGGVRYASEAACIDPSHRTRARGDPTR